MRLGFKRVIVPLYQPQESGHTAFALVEMARCNSTAHMTCVCVRSALRQGTKPLASFHWGVDCILSRARVCVTGTHTDMYTTHTRSVVESQS